MGLAAPFHPLPKGIIGYTLPRKHAKHKSKTSGNDFQQLFLLLMELCQQKKTVFISRKQHLKESSQRLLRNQHPKTTSWVHFAPQFFLAWRSGCKATGRHQSQILHTRESDHQTWGSRYDSPGCAIHNDTPAQNEQSRMKASLGIPSLATTSKCSVYSPRPPQPHRAHTVCFPTLIAESLEQQQKTSGLL